ncbi:hypothetical protein [Saezia sanguinis]
MTTDKDLDYYYASNIKADDYLDLIQYVQKFAALVKQYEQEAAC